MVTVISTKYTVRRIVLFFHVESLFAAASLLTCTAQVVSSVVSIVFDRGSNSINLTAYYVTRLYAPVYVTSFGIEHLLWLCQSRLTREIE